MKAIKNQRKAPSSMGESTPSSTSDCCSGLGQLDEDQLISILQLLPVESVVAFSMTCRKFRSLSCSDALWEAICRREWGWSSADAIRGGCSWKRVYQRVWQLRSLSCTRLLCDRGRAVPKPRGSHSLNFVSDCLVLFGGGCDGGRHLDDTWVAHVGGRWDPQKALDWQQVNSGQPSGRFGHACAVVADMLILFGGIDDNGRRHSDTWIGRLTGAPPVDIRLTWTLLEVDGQHPPPRGAHACCGFSKKMIVHGGIGAGGRRLSDLWVLDLGGSPGTASWHEIQPTGPRPMARSGHSLTWAGGSSLVLFGGRGSGYEALSDTWRLEEGETWRWREITSAGPAARVGHAAAGVVGGRMVVCGGEDTERRRGGDAWVLERGGKGWRKLQLAGLGCRSFHAACSDRSGSRVFVFGGMIDGVLGPAEVYGLRFDGALFLLDLLPAS
ncbi:kelch repeat-containing F-box family protein [Wolffia australiana]